MASAIPSNSSQAVEKYNHHFPQDRPRKSLLSKVLQSGDREQAEQIMLKRTGFTEEESWQIKAFKGGAWSEKDYTSLLQLSERTQRLVYRTANSFSNVALVASLNDHGFEKYTSLTKPTSPSLISPYMNAAAVRQTLLDWLRSLHKEGRLITQQQFEIKYSGSHWRKKGDDLTRLLGCDHLVRLIKELNLKHLKVPEKKAVIQDGTDTLSFDVSLYKDSLVQIEIPMAEIEIDENNWFENLDKFQESDIKIYAQEIVPSHRFMTLEEIDELFQLIEASNYGDFDPGNIIVAANGIYLVDTEFKSFAGTIEWDKLERFLKYISPQDRNIFLQRIKEKQAASTAKTASSFKQVLENLALHKEAMLQRLNEGSLTQDHISAVIALKQAVQPGKLVGADVKRRFSFSLSDIMTI